MDVSFFMEQIGGSAETAKMVLEEFLRQTPLDLQSIDTFLGAGDLVAAGKTAHSLKGSSGVMGAHELRQIAADLEMACRASEADQSATLNAQLKTEAKRCLEFIPTLMNSLG